MSGHGAGGTGSPTRLEAITVTPNDSAADSSIDYMQPIPGSEQSDLGAFLAAPGQVIRTHNYGQSAPDDAPLLIGGSGVDYGPRIGFVDYFNVIRGGIASFIPEGMRDFEYSRIVAESPRLSSVDNLEYDGITDYSVGNGKGWTLSLPTYGDVKAGLNKAYNALAATFGEGQNTRDVSGLEYKDIDSYPEDLGSGWRLSVPTGGQLVDYANAMYGRSLSASNAYRDAIEQDKHYRAGLAFGSDPIVQGMGLMVGAFGLTKPVSAYGRLGPDTKKLAGTAPLTNPGYPVAGRIDNCVNCAIATDRTFAGHPTSALPQFDPRGVPISEIPKALGIEGSFTKAKTMDDLTETFAELGAGSRGVVFGDRGPGRVGHVFNVVVDQRGAVKFWDGQSMSRPTLEGQGYSNFWWIRSDK
jgi:hypothetical protein